MCRHGVCFQLETFEDYLCSAPKGAFLHCGAALYLKLQYSPIFCIIKLLKLQAYSMSFSLRNLRLFLFQINAKLNWKGLMKIVIENIFFFHLREKVGTWEIWIAFVSGLLVVGSALLGKCFASSAFLSAFWLRVSKISCRERRKWNSDAEERYQVPAEEI